MAKNSKPDIDMSGHREVLRALKLAGKKLSDWRPAWKDVGTIIDESWERAVETQGTLIGEQWADVQEDYARRKRAAGYGSKPMVRTGKLLRELTRGRTKKAKKKLSLMVSSRIPYTYPLQLGSRYSRLPARRYTRLSQHAEALIQQAMLQRAEQIGREVVKESR